MGKGPRPVGCVFANSAGREFRSREEPLGMELVNLDSVARSTLLWLQHGTFPQDRLSLVQAVAVSALALS